MSNNFYYSLFIRFDALLLDENFACIFKSWKKKVHDFLEYKSLLEFLLLIYMYISWYFKVKKQKIMIWILATWRDLENKYVNFCKHFALLYKQSSRSVQNVIFYDDTIQFDYLLRHTRILTYVSGPSR